VTKYVKIQDKITERVEKPQEGVFVEHYLALR
jgi:hypothetical protein